MNLEDIRFLYEYNAWANARILASCARVTPEQYAAPAQLSHGSLRGTLVHALAVEVLWRQRCQGNSPSTATLSEYDLATFEELQSRWRKEEEAMRAYLDSLTETVLMQPQAYQTTRGVAYENTLWQLLAHVFNHGTQCRSEAAVALTAYGQSPGDLDMLYFFRR